VLLLVPSRACTWFQACNVLPGGTLQRQQLLLLLCCREWNKNSLQQVAKVAEGGREAEAQHYPARCNTAFCSTAAWHARCRMHLLVLASSTQCATIASSRINATASKQEIAAAQGLLRLALALGPDMPAAGAS
jgi:hypothetical protein